MKIPLILNVERMLKSVITKCGQVWLCGACCKARGIKAMPLLDGAEISTMSQLAQWTVEPDKALVFQLRENNTLPQAILNMCNIKT